eukprot:gene4096-5229_t
MEELAKTMNGRGVVAVLAGNQNAPNLQKRVQGVSDAAKKYPGITIRDVYYHKETPQDAAAKVEQVMQANPDITGWAMIGSWPLFTENALKWQPGTVKCVAVDALPAQLAYIRSGHVPVLLAQQCYQWGYKSVEHLINKIVLKKDPVAVKDISALIPVTKDNVDAFAKNWDKWLPKRGAPTPLYALRKNPLYQEGWRAAPGCVKTPARFSLSPPPTRSALKKFPPLCAHRALSVRPHPLPFS